MEKGCGDGVKKTSVSIAFSATKNLLLKIDLPTEKDLPSVPKNPDGQGSKNYFFFLRL